MTVDLQNIPPHLTIEHHIWTGCLVIIVLPMYVITASLVETKQFGNEMKLLHLTCNISVMG